MSGSQIGGAVGAVAGGIVGFYTGNIAAGVKWGYAIGSAIGGYVDPTKTSGPRIEDAQAQTSTVGGLIPFGYGVFTCAGNIIWTDRLIEHKKTERVGKGGSQKNTTYTYTRSYAIGVCEGPISGYLWIKRNGKLVYAADPTALGTAMGWDSKQISDLVASTNKFLQMATLYTGTSTQMPDSTIVAVQGVGNVSPHRDLAYIVLENEDLTDMQGAVSQYEFCVRATPPEAYFASQPYPQMFSDAAASSVRFSDGELKRLIVYTEPAQDTAATGTAFMYGETRSTVVKRSFEDTSQAVVDFVAGELKSVIQHLENTTDVAAPTVVFANGELRRVIIYPEPLQDHAAPSITFVSGELRIP